MSSSEAKKKKPRERVVERHAFVDPDDPDNDVRTAAESDAVVASIQDAINVTDDVGVSFSSKKKAVIDNDDDDKDDDDKKKKTKKSRKDKDKIDANNDNSNDQNAPNHPAPRHLDDLIACATEPLNESHVCDDATLAPPDMSPDLVAARTQMRAAMVVGAFRHTVLQAVLPDTLFRDHDMAFIQNSVFKTSDPSAELRSLAFDEISGRQRRLTRDQLAQLSRTGTFTVPSQRYPDLEHEWQVSALLVRGTSNILDDWRGIVAVSAGQLLWQVPGRFVRRDPEDFSVASAFISIFKGLFYALALLFGFIERYPAFGSSAADELGRLYGMLHLRGSGRLLKGRKDERDREDPPPTEYDSLVVDASEVDDFASVDDADVAAAVAASLTTTTATTTTKAPPPPRKAKRDDGKSDAAVRADPRDDVPLIDEATPFAHWPPQFHAPPNRLVNDLFLSRNRRAELDAWRRDGDSLPSSPSASERARWLCNNSSREAITALDDGAVRFERVLVARRFEISRVVESLVATQTAEWKDRHEHELAKVIRAVAGARGLDVDACLKGTDKELVRSIASEVSSDLARVYNAELLARIKGASFASVQDAPADLAQRVHDAVRAHWIVQQNRTDKSRVTSIRNRLEERRVQAARPVMSRVDGWFSAQMLAYNRQLGKTLDAQFDAATIAELRAAGNASEAYLYERSRVYGEQRRQADETRLATYKQPTRTFSMRVRIWAPSNWHITKTTKPAYYTVDKHDTWTVRTGHVLWRWHLYVVMTVAYWKNIVFYLLLANVFAGPLSLRALFSPHPYYPDKTVDERTGKIVPNENVKVNSFPYLLGKLWSNVSSMRREFEGRPDTGLIGKGVTRLFNLVWCYIIVGLFGTVLLVAFMPAAILLNCALSIVLGVTAIVWWPIALLIGFLFALLIYDWLHARYGDRWFPLPMALIGRVVVLGVLRLVLAVLFAVVVHPLVALCCFLFACLRAAARWTWDKLMMLLILKRRGRVPASDEFLTRRVRGPGLSFTCAFQIPTEAALVALRAQLELLELRELQRRVDWIETSPSVWLHRALKRTFDGVLASYSGSSQLMSEVRGRREVLEMRSEFQRALNARRKLIPDSVRNSDLRQTADMLSNTIAVAEQVVERFVSERILAALARTCPHVPDDMPGKADHDAASFWTRQSVKKDDFRALTAKLLTSALGARFLEPLEETDRVIKLEAEHTRMRDIVGNVLDGVKSPPLRVNTYVYNERELDSENDEKRVEQRIATTSSVPPWFTEAGI
jgi:hypothetical protein